jgi:hypothetical protein
MHGCRLCSVVLHIGSPGLRGVSLHHQIEGMSECSFNSTSPTCPWRGDQFICVCLSWGSHSPGHCGTSGTSSVTFQKNVLPTGYLLVLLSTLKMEAIRSYRTTRRHTVRVFATAGAGYVAGACTPHTPRRRWLSNDCCNCNVATCFQKGVALLRNKKFGPVNK